MGRYIYGFRPLQKGVSSEHPSFHQHYSHPVWGSINWIIKQNSIQKRWGYTSDRDFGAGVEIQQVARYDLKDGNSYTMVFTDADLCKRETSGSNTFSYKTETGDYNAGIDDITAAVVTGKAGTTWSTDGVAAGDKFILDDDHSPLIETDTHWAEVQTVDSETQITLTASYTGTTGSFTGVEKDALIRKVYTVPTNERWTYAIVDDKLCFTNGNTDVQYWDGSNYAGALDSTYAREARYCIEFGNRLYLADLLISGVRDPLALWGSVEGDPTDFDTGNGAVLYRLRDTADWITGLGKVGGNLTIYKKDSYMMYARTGDTTDPISRVIDRVGLGCVAPYSIVPFRGANAFLWRDDFYAFDGSQHANIGGQIRDKFFDLVPETEVERVYGFSNPLTSEIYWHANTLEGEYWFVWNHRYDEWYVNQYADAIFTGGRGVV